jgi:hypothetical protein
VDAPGRGAWIRAGISRDGGPLREEGRAVWLQVGEYYADSRGFAGRTEYDGVAVRFQHEVGEPGDDVGHLAASGDDIVETGTNTDGSTFLEIWRPLPDGGGDCGAWLSAGAQTVRVGSHVVHVDGTGGEYRTLP